MASIQEYRHISFPLSRHPSLRSAAGSRNLAVHAAHHAERALSRNLLNKGAMSGMGTIPLNAVVNCVDEESLM